MEGKVTLTPWINMTSMEGKVTLTPWINLIIVWKGACPKRNRRCTYDTTTREKHEVTCCVLHALPMIEGQEVLQLSFCRSRYAWLER